MVLFIDKPGKAFSLLIYISLAAFKSLCVIFCLASQLKSSKFAEFKFGVISRCCFRKNMCVEKILNLIKEKKYTYKNMGIL